MDGPQSLSKLGAEERNPLTLPGIGPQFQPTA
jgi:hypothetical protein